MRTVWHLNFDWKYSPDFKEEYLKPDYDYSSFETVQIPHTNKELPFNYFDERDYQFVSCYKKTFTLEPKEGKRYLLHFEGAANYSKVYLNGKFIGEHKGGYTPFTFDITDTAVKGENLITVELDSTERPEIPPFGRVVDYLCYGGIYREVWLEEVSETYIENVFVRTKYADMPNKLIDADITFSESTKGTMELFLMDGEEIVKTKKFAFEGKVIKAKWRAENVTPWDIDNPKLYTLKIVLNGGEDETEVRFGFREAEFRKDGFYLNGKKIKIRGLNRHQSYPYVGYAMPKSAQESDADLLKFKLGCNLVRTSHYPDSIHFLNRCDEIGLLVFTEMPSWQFTGEGEWRENCLENIRRMIIRDRNHPSVILWGVRVNEGQDCDELYTQTNALAHSLDDTRQTGGVRNFPRSHLLEDVYTYNDFIHSGGKVVLLPPEIVAGFSAPYLVTEHNGHMYPTKSFDKEDVRVEHALRHARVLNKAYGNGRTSGAIGWCMADYNTHKDFGSGDRICYHGVTDMFRVPKLAASVYASQQDDHTVMEVSSSMDIGEHPASMKGQIYVFTNCDYVKLYKNGAYVSTAYPNHKRFPNLPHPPIFADDFIGDVLEKDEKLNKAAAKLIKPALIEGCKKGTNIPVPYYLLAGVGMAAGGIGIGRLVNIIEKYVGDWGDEQVSYRFEGYKDGMLVKTVIKTAVTKEKLKVDADKLTLCEKETYDVSRVQITAVDQNGNRLAFANNAITLSVRGAVEVIGPKQISLIGGDIAFWVKTKGQTGKGVVTIKSPGFDDIRVDFVVEKAD